MTPDFKSQLFCSVALGWLFILPMSQFPHSVLKPRYVMVASSVPVSIILSKEGNGAILIELLTARIHVFTQMTDAVGGPSNIYFLFNCSWQNNDTLHCTKMSKSKFLEPVNMSPYLAEGSLRCR